jgi:polysaccharide deacetylase
MQRVLDLSAVFQSFASRHGGLTMLPHERIPYSPIKDRPRLTLPGGARLVVWVIVNVEDWNPHEALPRTVLSPPAGGSPIPDIPNWAWHEYGNRVGFWRFIDVLDRFHIRAALAINGSAIQTYEPIARAALEREWEFIGHGFGQKNMQKVPDERADIAKTTEVIKNFIGRRPRGWLGPGLTETWDTPDILAEAGYDYLCDWVLDDQPVLLKTRTRTLVSVPYTQECDDVDSTPHGGRIQTTRHRSIRTTLCRCSRIGAGAGPRDTPIHHGRAPSASLSKGSARIHPAASRRRFLDGRANPRLVSWRHQADAAANRRTREMI